MKNLKIRTKLFILVVFMMAGIIIIGISSLLFMSTINDNTTEIASNWLPSTILAEEMNTAVSDVRTQEFKHVVSQDAKEMDKVNTKLDQLSENFIRMQKQYNELAVNETDRQLLSDIQKAWDSYLAEGESMIKLSAENKTTEAMAIMNGEHLDNFDSLTAKCLELVQFNKSGSDAANEQADIAYAVAQKLTIGLLSGLSVVTVLFAFYIVHSITKPVSEIDNVARKIADGELNESIRYQSKDELGVLAVNFNKTVTRLRDYVNYIDEISSILNEVADGNLLFQLTYDYAGEFAKVKTALEHISDSLNTTLTQINQSSEQVASGSQALSQGATEQASSIEELAATINDISQQVSQNAESAKNASRQASIVGEQITVSNDSMKHMTIAMNEISEKSSQIGKIIKTIEDIAFQTNILALNAAVEAARAGEAGKGFAVVADEVRNLASKSAEASKDTANLIEGSMQAVEKGTQIANSTAEQLSQVVSGAQEIVNTIDDIATASQRQSDSIRQVTTGVDQISSVIQTNSATAEESAAASEELSGQAQILKNLVSKFRLKDSNNSFSGYE